MVVPIKSTSKYPPELLKKRVTGITLDYLASHHQQTLRSLDIVNNPHYRHNGCSQLQIILYRQPIARYASHKWRKTTRKIWIEGQ